MIHYLLDELHTYKEDYSDALCPIPRGADESHLGEATLVAPLTTDEARRMMQVQVAATYEAVQRAWASSHIPVADVDTRLQSTSLAFSIPENLHQPPISSNTNVIPIPSHPPLPMLRDADISRDHRGHLVSKVGFESQTGQLHANNPNPLRMAPKDPSRIIPPVPRGPDGWKQVVRDWEYPDPHRALEFALKDWEPSWYSGSRAASLPSGSLYNQRRLIATEFIQM